MAYGDIRRIRKWDGTGINPATDDSMTSLIALMPGVNAYQISDMDTAGTPNYFGYLDADGNWYIKELNETLGTVRYIAGTTGYIAAWAARATQVYGYYNAIF